MASEKVSRKMVLEIKYVNANDAVIHTENSKLLLDLNCSPKELEKTVVTSCGIEQNWFSYGYVNKGWKRKSVHQQNERFSSVQVKVRVSK